MAQPRTFRRGLSGGSADSGWASGHRWSPFCKVVCQPVISHQSLSKLRLSRTTYPDGPGCRVSGLKVTGVFHGKTGFSLSPTDRMLVCRLARAPGWLLEPQARKGGERGAWKGLPGRGEGESRLQVCNAPGPCDTGRPPPSRLCTRETPLPQAHVGQVTVLC